MMLLRAFVIRLFRAQHGFAVDGHPKNGGRAGERFASAEKPSTNRAPITAPSANLKNESVRAAVLPAYFRSPRSGRVGSKPVNRRPRADRLHLLLEKRAVVINIGNGVDN
jgi:hypothetical protein